MNSREASRKSHQSRNIIFRNSSFYYIHTNEIPNHFSLIVFWCEKHNSLCSHSKGDIFTCGDNMLFSHVKISSFCTKAHLVFHWCLYNKPDYYMYSPTPELIIEDCSLDLTLYYMYLSTQTNLALQSSSFRESWQLYWGFAHFESVVPVS